MVSGVSYRKVLELCFFFNTLWGICVCNVIIY